MEIKHLKEATDQVTTEKDARIRTLESELEEERNRRIQQIEEAEARHWVELQSVKETYSSSLAASIAEKEKLEKRNRRLSKKNDERKHALNVWARRENNIPPTVVAVYVESPEFKDFIQEVGTEGYLTGALTYKEAIMRYHPRLVIEGADLEIPVINAESGVKEVPPGLKINTNFFKQLIQGFH